MLPSLSAVSPCGPDCAVFRGNSLITPVRGSSRPTTFAICPVYQMKPSAVASGSCGREPGVGTLHSLIETLALPGTRAARGPGLGGKFLAKYSATKLIWSSRTGAPALYIM